MNTPRVLVACEYSGIVREAFAGRGWDAYSCDLLDTEQPSPNHIIGDVIPLLQERWDLVVAHPPCTYLSNSGVRWLTNPDGSKNQERWDNMVEAAEFFNLFTNANSEHIAIENPVMHGYGKKLVGGGATQFVQPYHFGVTQSKRTGLRLIGLPELVHTDDVHHIVKTMPYAEVNKVHYASPGPDRWKERSRTFPAIAQAMADQWGPYIENKMEVAA